MLPVVAAAASPRFCGLLTDWTVLRPVSLVSAPGTGADRSHGLLPTVIDGHQTGLSGKPFCSSHAMQASSGRSVRNCSLTMRLSSFSRDLLSLEQQWQVLDAGNHLLNIAVVF